MANVYIGNGFFTAKNNNKIVFHGSLQDCEKIIKSIADKKVNRGFKLNHVLPNNLLQKTPRYFYAFISY